MYISNIPFIKGDIVAPLGRNKYFSETAKVLEVRGDVLLCITSEGKTFPVNKNRVKMYEAAAPFAVVEVPFVAPDAPKQVYQTIEHKASKPVQKTLF